MDGVDQPTDWVIARASLKNTSSGGSGDGLDIGALALEVVNTAASAGGSGGQAGDGARWDLSDQVRDRLGVSGGRKESDNDGVGELHFD